MASASTTRHDRRPATVRTHRGLLRPPIFPPPFCAPCAGDIRVPERATGRRAELRCVSGNTHRRMRTIRRRHRRNSCSYRRSCRCSCSHRRSTGLKHGKGSRHRLGLSIRLTRRSHFEGRPRRMETLRARHSDDPSAERITAAVSRGHRITAFDRGTVAPERAG